MHKFCEDTLIQKYAVICSKKLNQINNNINK